VTSRRRPAGRHEGRHDLEIARSVIPRPIVDVARDLGIADGELKLYCPTKAKVTLEAIRRLEADRPRGKYVVVTAIARYRSARASRRRRSRTKRASAAPSRGTCRPGPARGRCRRSSLPRGSLAPATG
jgi:hypothetical protein